MDKRFIILQIVTLCLLVVLLLLKIIEISTHSKKEDIVQIEAEGHLGLLEDAEISVHNDIYEYSHETTEETSQTIILLAEIHKNIDNLQRNVSRTTERRRDEEIISMLTEKLVNDYTENALKYFNDSDYNNAINAFTLALRHQPDNTTLQFYLLYSLYLRQRLITLNEEELLELQLKAEDLKNVEFRENELLEHSITDINTILTQISDNVNVMLLQLEQNKNDYEINEEVSYGEILE